MTTLTTVSSVPAGPALADGRRSIARVAELDAIRGYAALAVLGYHLFSYFLPFGWAAVDLFFVLSGFLITTIILNGLDRPGFLKQFYIRRASRIFPIYYLAIAVVVMLNPWLPSPYDLAKSLPWYLTYTQNAWLYWGGEGEFLRILSHTWTLAIEEQFYLLWPLMLCLGGRSSLLPLCLMLIVVSAVARYLGFHEHLLVTKCDGFAFGAIGSLVIAQATNARLVALALQWFVTMLAVGSVLLFAGALWFGVHRFSGDENSVVLDYAGIWMPVVYVACLGLVGTAALAKGHWALWPLRISSICYIGKISYGLYLYHYMVIVIVRQFPAIASTLGRLPSAVLIASLSIAIAALSWHFIEDPILRWKERFERKPAIA